MLIFCSCLMNAQEMISGSQSDEEYVLVSSGTFECPVESDGTLLLSTLQGQIPHANGLHFTAPNTNRLRAIR